MSGGLTHEPVDREAVDHGVAEWELSAELGAEFAAEPPDGLLLRYPWAATWTSRNTCLVVDRSLPRNQVTEFDVDGRVVWRHRASPRLNVCVEAGAATRVLVDNRRFLRVTADGRQLAAWSSGLPEIPKAACAEPSGDIVLACPSGLYRLSRSGETRLLVASSESTFRDAQDVHLGPDGTLVVTDGATSCVVLLGRDGRRHRILGTWRRPGRGDNELLTPNGACMTPDGWIYVAETRGHRILAFAPDGTRAGEVPVRSPEPHSPATVRPGPEGDLLVSDTGNHRVFRCGRDGRIRWELGRTPYRSRLFSFPRTVERVRDGFLVCDSFNDRVVRLDEDGSPLATYGRGGDLGTDLGLSVPRAASETSAGDLCVADGLNSRVLVIDPKGSPRREITAVRSPTLGAVALRDPHQVAETAGGLLHIVDSDLNAVLWVDEEGEVRREWFGCSEGRAFSDPHQAHWSGDALYVADSANDRVVAVDTTADGGRTSSDPPWQMAFSYPRCVRVAADGTVMVVDSDGNRIARFAKDRELPEIGPVLPLAAHLPPINPELRRPKWVTTVDHATLAVADMLNSRVVVLRRRPASSADY